MPVLTRSVRLISLSLAGVVSLIAGILLAERIIQPGIIDDFGTSALLGLILMLVLPVVTAFALRHDRRVALAAVRDTTTGAPIASPLPAAQFARGAVTSPESMTGQGSNLGPDLGLEMGLEQLLAMQADSAVRAVRHGAHARTHAPVARTADGAPMADTHRAASV